MHGRTAAIELDTLILTGKETGGPLAGRDGLRIAASLAGQHHKPGKFVRVVPKP